MMKKRFLFMLGMLIGGISGAWAEQVSYLDLLGQTQTVNATAITSSSETLTTGWYNIKGIMTNNNRLKVADGADVNIILEQSAYFFNPKGITCNEGSRLTIWAQKKDAGIWKIETPDHYDAAMGGEWNHNSGVITINGGVITAKAITDPRFQPGVGTYLPVSAAIGGGGNGDVPRNPGGKGHVYINGGIIEAHGGMSAAAIGGGCYASGDVIINGGTIKAYGNMGINPSTETGYGIGGGYRSTGSTVTLNYINDVSITSDSYNGAVTFQKTFSDGSRVIDPCILENGTGLENKTLVPGGDFAVWCEDNSTLYFGSGSLPSVGDQYKGNTVTDVWIGDAVNNTPLSYAGHILPVDSRYPGWSAYSSNITSVVFDPSFAHARPKSTSHWFYEMYYLSSITGLEHLNTSQVVSMYSMFYACNGLTSLDISNFDLSNLISSALMFYNNFHLTTLYSNADWKTDKLTDSECMFFQCSSLKGAIKYSYGKAYDVTQANPKTGYFTGKWDVSIAGDIEYGAVECAQSWAYTNEMVTITVTPDPGYELESISIETVDGNAPSGAPSSAPRKAAVDFTPGDEAGTYTFTMPAAPVTVNATFKAPVITAVEDINVSTAKSGQRYNLMGQPVGNDYRGIIIENGQKRVIK